MIVGQIHLYIQNNAPYIVAVKYDVVDFTVGQIHTTSTANKTC